MKPTIITKQDEVRRVLYISERILVEKNQHWLYREKNLRYKKQEKIKFFLVFDGGARQNVDKTNPATPKKKEKRKQYTQEW